MKLDTFINNIHLEGIAAQICYICPGSQRNRKIRVILSYFIFYI